MPTRTVSTSADIRRILKHVRIRPGSKFRIAKHDTAWVPGDALRPLEAKVIKDRAQEILKRNVAELADAQELLWASDTHSVLIVFQAMDAAGKDGTIKHVASGLDPTGCEVRSFKAPSIEELDHTFLWRAMKAVPERGKITIFNRSHYEDVLIVKVRPELLAKAKLPLGMRGVGEAGRAGGAAGEKFWKQRYDDINAFERHLVRNGTLILKFFLNVSKEEQGERFRDRLSDPDKQWKFALADLDSRDRWDDYMTAYEDAINATSTTWAPWHIIPADHKWVMRAMVSGILAAAIRGLDLSYPKLTAAQKRELVQARKRLEGEKGDAKKISPRRRGGR